MSTTTTTTRKYLGMSASTFPFVLGLAVGAVGLAVYGALSLFSSLAG